LTGSAAANPARPLTALLNTRRMKDVAGHRLDVPQ
jgi:hypothetical protein